MLINSFDMQVPEGFDHDEIVASGFSTGKGYHLFALNVDRYPDGTPYIRFSGEGVDTLLLRPKSLTTFMAAMFFVDALRARDHSAPQLLLPLVPGSRQDRLLSEGDFLFTAKSIADEINRRGFPSVTVIDPHSNVTPALIDRCRVMTPADLIADDMNRVDFSYNGVISPDAGAESRASGVARVLGLPLLRGWKKRDIGTGKLSGFGLQDLPHKNDESGRGGHYLVVDDICDGGGTFIGLAEEIHKQQATADLYTTHGLYTLGLTKLLKSYQRVITTDSCISSELIDTTTADQQTNRLHKRIIESRNGRWQVIPICKKLMTEGF
jgi:ribose-phosphate pyrophosphokinase